MTIRGICPWDIFTKTEFASSVVGDKNVVRTKMVMMIKTKTVVAMSEKTVKMMKMKKVMKTMKRRSDTRRGQTQAATQAEFPL